jgi:hypothetical protein
MHHILREHKQRNWAATYRAKKDRAGKASMLVWLDRDLVKQVQSEAKRQGLANQSLLMEQIVSSYFTKQKKNEEMLKLFKDFWSETA